MFIDAFNKARKKGENVYSTGNSLHVMNVPQTATATSTNTTGAIAKTVAPGAAWRLMGLNLHLSAAGGAGNLTITSDAGAGAAYDTLLYSQDMTSITDLVLGEEDIGQNFSATDEIDVAWANASNRTYGLEIIYMLL
jgi:hypothetical protein